MEDKKEVKLSQGKLILQYGLILGGIIVGIQLLSYVFNLVQAGSVVGLLVFLVILVIGGVVMVKAASLYRDEALGGYMKYGKAFVISFLIALVAVAIVAIYTYLFYAFFDPEFLEKSMQEAMNQIQNNPDIPADRKEEIINNMGDRYTPISSAISAFTSMLIFFIIVSLITAAVAKKKEVESSKLI
jgi:Protein of unknown function (DUF4199)